MEKLTRSYTLGNTKCQSNNISEVLYFRNDTWDIYESSGNVSRLYEFCCDLIPSCTRSGSGFCVRTRHVNPHLNVWDCVPGTLLCIDNNNFSGHYRLELT